MERQCITQAYKNFVQWAQNVNASEDWYLFEESDKVFPACSRNDKGIATYQKRVCQHAGIPSFFDELYKKAKKREVCFVMCTKMITFAHYL
jgi:hypothetical protein